MALFKKKEEEQVFTPQPAAPVEEPKPVEIKPVKAVVPSTITKIGEGITFYGNFETKDALELNGTIQGDINSSSVVSISKGASYIGNANMQNLNVDGTIDGDIICKETSTFNATAKMKGNLQTAYLVTEKGSKIMGNLSLKQDAEEAPAAAEAPAEEGDVEVTEEDIFGTEN